MTEIIYKDLSYKIIGIAFRINGLLGSGLEEKVYQNAFEEYLKESKIAYEREMYHTIKINEKTISKKYFDFLIENKVIVEIKTGVRDYRDACSQIFHYLKMSKLKLGLLIRFTRDGVKVKRIPNIKSSPSV